MSFHSSSSHHMSSLSICGRMPQIAALSISFPAACMLRTPVAFRMNLSKPCTDGLRNGTRYRLSALVTLPPRAKFVVMSAAPSIASMRSLCVNFPVFTPSTVLLPPLLARIVINSARRGAASTCCCKSSNLAHNFPNLFFGSFTMPVV